MNQPSGTRWSLATLAAVLGLSALRDASLLFSYPVAVGADGYYYILQINQLLNHGHLYFTSHTPLVFYYLAALNEVTRNPVIAVKLGSLILNLILCIGTYALVSSITSSRWLGVLGATIAAFSGMHFYMVAEFIKNLGAVALLIWGIWCSIRAVRVHRAGWITLSVVLILAAFLSHISIWGIAPVLLILTFLVLLTNAEGSRVLRLIVAAGILILMVSPGLLAFQKLVALPPWLGNELLVWPKSPITLRSPVGKGEMLALILAAPLTLFLMAKQKSVWGRNYPSVALGSLALWTLLITLNPFLNHDVSQFGIVGRLDHLMYLQMAILLPGVIWLVFRISHKAAGAVLALTFALMAISMAEVFPKGLQPWYLEERQQLIQALPEQREQLGLNPLVIAPHGDEFVLMWVIGVPAQQTLKQYKDRSVFWLLHQVDPTILTPSMAVVIEEGNGTALALVRHEELTQWIRTITEKERTRILAQNPHLKKYFDDEFSK